MLFASKLPEMVGLMNRQPPVFFFFFSYNVIFLAKVVAIVCAFAAQSKYQATDDRSVLSMSPSKVNAQVNAPLATPCPLSRFPSTFSCSGTHAPT